MTCEPTRLQMQADPSDPRHGTENGYKNLRCRCDRCREAQAKRMRETRARYRYAPTWRIPHGTAGGYTNYACRCRPCTDAHAALIRRCRQRKEPAA